MCIDSHVHIWDVDLGSYAWLEHADQSLNRSFTLAEALSEAGGADINRMVLVQAADNAGDTTRMLEAADRHEEVAGVVARSPLEHPDEFATRLADLAANKKVVGIRNLTHDQNDSEWLDQPSIRESLGILERSGFALDLVTTSPAELRHVLWIGEAFPDLRVVVDHLSKPPIGKSLGTEWRDLLTAAAKNPLVFAKASGLYAAQGNAASWTQTDIRSWLDFAAATFGPERLMWGSDWPVCVPGGGYERVLVAAQKAFVDLSQSDQELIFGGTAQAFYRL